MLERILNLFTKAPHPTMAGVAPPQDPVDMNVIMVGIERFNGHLGDLLGLHQNRTTVGGFTRFKLPNSEWSVHESDGCMDFTTVAFTAYGTRSFILKFKHGFTWLGHASTPAREPEGQHRLSFGVAGLRVIQDPSDLQWLNHEELQAIESFAQVCINTHVERVAGTYRYPRY